MRRALLLFASVTAIATPAVAVRAQPAAAAMQAVGEPYADLVVEAAQRFGIPASWIRAVIRHESGGNPRAISSKGAMGLMQLMPDTWSALRARLGLGSDPFDRHDNIVAGTAFMREMHDRYGSPGFLAAYSAGPGRYEDYRDRHRPLPAETLAYVAALLPVVGGDDGAEPVVPAALDPLAWTRAPIFIVRSAGVPAAAQATSQRPSRDAPVADSVHDVSAIAPQSTGLFVSVSATGPKQ